MNNMTTEKIDLDLARKLQQVGNVFSTSPSSYEVFDLPTDFMDAYKQFTESKDRFNEVLTKYGMEHIL